MELLRIIAMIMILVLHTRYDGIIAVYDGDISLNHIMKFMFEALSIIGVNLFILISGYFGINLRKESVVKLLFQIYFFGLLALIVWIFMQGSLYIDSRHYIKALFPVSQTIWFISCYFMLMIFSPMLNAFVQKYNLRYITIFTLFLYALSYWWGTLLPTIGGFGGYSWGWFLILYLTGRIIRTYTDQHVIKRRLALLGYVLCTALIVLLAIIQMRYPIGRSLLWNYDFPLVYISSICFFLCFVNMKLGYSRVINWFAVSAFAVLLLHVSHFFRYNQVCKFIYENSSGLSCLFLTALYILSVYVTAVIIDQFRIYLYKKNL